MIVAVCRDASSKDLRTKRRTLPHLSPTVGEAQAAILAVSEAALGHFKKIFTDRIQADHASNDPAPRIAKAKEPTF